MGGGAKLRMHVSLTAEVYNLGRREGNGRRNIKEVSGIQPENLSELRTFQSSGAVGKVEVDVLPGLPDPNSPYGRRGRKATVKNK